jgi:hypothetical protein
MVNYGTANNRKTKTTESRINERQKLPNGESLNGEKIPNGE